MFLKPITSTYLTGRGKIATKQRIELIVLEKLTASLARNRSYVVAVQVFQQYWQIKLVNITRIFGMPRKGLWNYRKIDVDEKMKLVDPMCYQV